jgi:hypothetical protein
LTLSLCFIRIASSNLWAAASSYTAAQLEFWRQGLGLSVTQNPTQCPFCEETTITPGKVENIRDRIKADQNLSNARSSFLRETEKYIAELSSIELKLPQLEFSEISEESKSTLLSISEMGHFLNRTLWHDQAALTSSLRPWL